MFARFLNYYRNKKIDNAFHILMVWMLSSNGEITRRDVQRIRRVSGINHPAIEENRLASRLFKTQDSTQLHKTLHHALQVISKLASSEEKEDLLTVIIKLVPVHYLSQQHRQILSSIAEAFNVSELSFQTLYKKSTGSYFLLPEKNQENIFSKHSSPGKKEQKIHYGKLATLKKHYQEEGKIRKAKRKTKSYDDISNTVVRPHARSAYMQPKLIKIRLAVNSERRDALHQLGLHTHAGQEEIRRSYRRLTQAYHPDKHIDKTRGSQNTIAQQYAVYRQAYEILN